MKNIDINQIKHLYYHEKKSASEIARVFDCGITLIYTHMKRNGMQRRSKSESQQIRYNNRTCDKTKTESGLAEMVRLYFEEHLSLAEVGKRLGVSHDTVRERLLTAGYQTRKRGESRHLQKSRGRIFTEAELSQMKRLYCEEELSSAAIASILKCSNLTIRTHLKQQGVQLRTVKEAQALRRKKETAEKSASAFESKAEGNDLAAESLPNPDFSAERKKLAKEGAAPGGHCPVSPSLEIHHIRDRIPKEQVTPARILQLRNEENLTIDAIAERCSLSNMEVYNILEEIGGI